MSNPGNHDQWKPESEPLEGEFKVHNISKDQALTKASPSFRIIPVENGLELMVYESSTRERKYVFYKFEHLATWLEDYVIPTQSTLTTKRHSER